MVSPTIGFVPQVQKFIVASRCDYTNWDNGIYIDIEPAQANAESIIKLLKSLGF